jgi:undecaprenyl pyrophosphate phosphatase UppP
MSNYISISEVMLLATLVAIFVILFVTMLKILRQVSFFQGKTAVIMALCVSVLCIVGLSQFLAIPGVTYSEAGIHNETSGPISHLLLPYVALAVAVAVMLSQVLLFASKDLSVERPKTSTKESGCGRTKPRGRPKNDSPSSKNEANENAP